MKLLRYGPAGSEKPGMLDDQGRVRDLSAHVADIADEVLTPEGLARLAALDRHDAAGGEAAALADAVDLVEDRHRGVAAEQEVGVQRVRRPARRYGAARRHQRLRHHLPAEDPGPAHPRAHAPEQVLLQALQVEDVEKLCDDVGHAAGGAFGGAVSYR